MQEAAGRPWWERIASRLDAMAGGRHATHRVPRSLRETPEVVRGFRIVAVLLAGLFLIGGGAVLEAANLTYSGRPVSGIVWWRLLVILAIASTLFYFWWRARLGYWWAYSRLRLFSIVFPVVAVGTSLIPGLYPRWMVVEQLLFSSLLIAVFALLSRPAFRAVYRRPGRSTPE